jgi:hypothetical protein
VSGVNRLGFSLHFICQIHQPEITEELFQIEVSKEKDLHISLKLLPKNVKKAAVISCNRMNQVSQLY